MLCFSNSRSGTEARFSATVFPVTVMQLPWINPFCNKYFITKGTPPMLCKSSIRYFPDGLKSAITGTLSLMACTSSCVNVSPTLCAMAIMCNTALVEPPSAMMMVSAFSNASFVMMSEGLMSFSKSTNIALPASAHSFFLSLLSAGLEEE